jgi:ABC-type Zn2+ transport system substrate-binding protein/surface adhesin
VACLDDHPHGHDHGHAHGPDGEHEHDEHAHAITMLAVVPYAGDVGLDAPASTWLRPVLAQVAAADVLEACASPVAGCAVPWDARPAAATPAAGQRLLL